MKVKSEARSEEEKNLVLQMQTGSNSQRAMAFNKLYERHHEALFFHCLKKYHGNREETEDTVQEVFVRVHSKINTFDPDKSVFSTWLYKVANNYIIDQIRKTNVEVLSFDKLAVNSSDNSDNHGSQSFQIEDRDTLDNHEAYINKERKQLVVDAINQLDSDKAKRVMHLVYLEEMQHEEVSKILNMPVGTIKALVHRAKSALKLHLETTKFEYSL